MSARPSFRREPGGTRTSVPPLCAHHLAWRAFAPCLPGGTASSDPGPHRRRLYPAAPRRSRDADTRRSGKGHSLAFGAPLESARYQRRQCPRCIYGYDLLLLRPDMHVVWRGNKLPTIPPNWPLSPPGTSAFRGGGVQYIPPPVCDVVFDRADGLSLMPMRRFRRSRPALEGSLAKSRTQVGNPRCLRRGRSIRRSDLRGAPRPTWAIPARTLYRYLKALTDAGLLSSLPGLGYVLGSRIIELDYKKIRYRRSADPAPRGR